MSMRLGMWKRIDVVGLGIDRFVRWIVGANRISDTRFFPRVRQEDERCLSMKTER